MTLLALVKLPPQNRQNQLCWKIINNLCSDNNIDFKIGNVDPSLTQRDGSQLLQCLQLSGDRLLWKGSLEMLKNLTGELLQKQGKWTSPGGAVKRFKSIEGRAHEGRDR